MYVAVPTGHFQGGRLLLRHPKRCRAAAAGTFSLDGAVEEEEGEGEGKGVEVDCAVAPALNRAVAFRGDAEHCVEATVRGATSGAEAGVGPPGVGPSGAGKPVGASLRCRTSVVLEQYCVAPGSYDATVRFEIVKPEDYLRAYG